jgi:hypothetical protein
MSKRGDITVHLPNLKPTVALPPRLAKLLDLVINSGAAGINTLELTSAGCINPAEAISEIRARGGLLETCLWQAVDSGGEVHPRVAHYIYRGWRPDVNLPGTVETTEEDSV